MCRKTKVLPLYFCQFQMAYAQERRVYWAQDPGEEQHALMTQSEQRIVRWTEPAGGAGPGGQHAVPQLQVQLTPAAAPGFIDSHCHLDLLFQRDGSAETLAEYMKDARVDFPSEFKGCLTVFCRPSAWARTTSWMRILEDGRVHGAFGCHPHHANEWDGSKESQLLELFRSHPRLVAVGEMGLDFSRNNHVSSDVQRKVLLKQLQIAVYEELPVILHLREAEREGIEIVERFVPHSQRIHWHCVTGQWPVVRMVKDLFENSVFGFTPLIANPRACNARMVAQELPLDRIVVESDAPYFLPQEHRGVTRWSHPGMALEVVKTLANLHDTSMDDIMEVTTRNTVKLYGLDAQTGASC